MTKLAAFILVLMLSACGGDKSNQQTAASPVAPMSKPQTASSDQMPPAGDPLWAIPPDRSPLWQEIRSQDVEAGVRKDHERP